MLINSSNNIFKLFGNSPSNKRCNYCHEKKILNYSCLCQEKLFCSLNCYNKYKISSTHKCMEKIPSKKSFSSKKEFSFSQQQKKIQYQKKNNYIYSLTNKSLKCLVGSKNLGNTCYINSAIQSLNNIYEFANYFLLNEFDYNKYEMLYRFSRIIKKLHYGTEKVIDVYSFKNLIGKKLKIYSGNTQEDCQEFLMSVLDELNEELIQFNIKKNKTESFNNSNNSTSNTSDNNYIYINNKIENGEKEFLKYISLNPTLISSLFLGQFRSSVQCFHCKAISNTFENFLFLSLPIPTVNKINFNIYFIYFNIIKGIIEINVSMESDLIVLDLRNLISSILNVHPLSFIICQMENNNIERIFNNLSSVMELYYVNNDIFATKNKIFCFQLDDNIFNYENNKYFNNKKNIKNYKKFYISDINIEPTNTYYTEIDKNFIDLYSNKFFF